MGAKPRGARPRRFLLHEHLSSGDDEKSPVLLGSGHGWKPASFAAKAGAKDSQLDLENNLPLTDRAAQRDRSVVAKTTQARIRAPSYQATISTDIRVDGNT